MKAIEYFKKITKNIKHGNGLFYDHCYGVYSFLKERSLPEYVCLAGLYHSIYGTEYFKPDVNINRNLVKKLIGNKAEKLVYLFCNIKNRDNFILKIAEKNKNLFFIAYANLVEPSNYQENASKEYLDFKHKYYLKYQSLSDSFKTSKKIEIIDDFLNEDYVDKLTETFFSNEFQWYYMPSKVNDQDKVFQLFHFVVENSQITSKFFETFNPLFEKLNAKKVFRLKINTTFKSKKIKESAYHKDNDRICKTAVLYLNTNNGYTKFKNGKKITSKRNRIVIFNSNFFHCGTNCTDKEKRVVININYI